MVMVNSVWGRFLGDKGNEINKKQPGIFPFLKQLKMIGFKNNLLILGCQNLGLKNYLEPRLGLVTQLLEEYLKNKIAIKLIVDFQPKKNKEMPLLSYQPTLEDVLLKSGFSKRYSFENFAVSSSNQVAYAAAQAVVNNPGTAYNPLFLYGGVGVGKTHLAQAIGRKILENNPEKKIYFCPGDLFTNELIESIREKNTPKFRRKYRYLNLLIIDDVQFIAGKQSVQEEFFHTFNSIISSGGQIVLTSDRSPTEIDRLEDRLRSRFSGGLIIDIQPPDFELRTAILLIKAQEKNINIDIGAAKLIAEKITDPRTLEGVLLSIYAKIVSEKDLIETDDVMKFFLIKKEKEIKKIGPQEIIRAVCSYYNIRLSKIKGTEKESQIVLPRQIAMYLLRFYLKLKLNQVAFFLNRKDHTTVIHAVNKISRLLVKDPILKKEVDNIVSSLELST